MSFNITFDYRFDIAGFFDDPARRAALEAAAAELESVIRDDFDPIPAGSQFEIENPEDGVTEELITLTDAVDDVIIFAAASNISSLGRAGPDGYSLSGDVYHARIATDFRNMGPTTDFEPWAGTVVFDQNADWSFDISGPVDGLFDFMSVAIHEIVHVLGFGTSPAFDAFISNGDFAGVNSLAVNGGNPIPLDGDLSHVEDGFLQNSVALDPTIGRGIRKLLTDIDKAMLADIGYEIDGFVKQGTQPAVATDGAETIFGTALGDVIDGLGGDDQIQGGEGNDTLQGGSGFDGLFGQGGTDSFVLAPATGVNRAFDFDVATETVILLDTAFTSAEQAVAAITKPFSNVSRITLSDGSYLDLFHNSQSGTPLTASNFALQTTPQPNVLPTGQVTLIGEAVEGQTLSADTSEIADADGLGAFSYIWFRNGVSIPGATSANYTLSGADVGAQIVVLVTYTDGRGTAESLASAATTSVTQTTGTAASDVLTGGSAADVLTGLAGDDTITGDAGNDQIDGGGGADTAIYSGDQNSYTLQFSPTEVTVIDRRSGGDGTDTLMNVEFLDFNDELPLFGDAPMDLGRFGWPTTLSDEAWESFIELYIAYFNRAPDAIGLAFWGGAFAGGTTLSRMAAFFIDQAETRATYPETLTNADFATAVYNNVLGRLPDQAGFDFWVGLAGCRAGRA
jgi:Ca2+-binding RTX toxin-like protein